MINLIHRLPYEFVPLCGVSEYVYNGNSIHPPDAMLPSLTNLHAAARAPVPCDSDT